MMGTQRIEAKVKKETADKLQGYANDKYNGNRGLAVKEACEELVKRKCK
jgi:hypothetical protein